MNLLLHICCAPCSTGCLERLFDDGFKVAGFFYNPNIQPLSEYNRRYVEVVRLSKLLDFKLYTVKYDTSRWFRAIKGLENEPEGGKRCEVCYRLRLIETAQTAKRHGFESFTTTLSISPHKIYGKIKSIGEEIAQEYELAFLSYDFKKMDGFKRSIELSRQHNLYRQKYCGCLFSRNKNWTQINADKRD